MKVRKRKLKHIEPTLNLIDDSTLSTPSPDYGMSYKGSDMFWYPENHNPERRNGKIDPMEELLLLKD